MDGITLREYRLGDWEAMYALDVQCFEPPFRFSRRAMRGFAEAQGAITILAMAEGNLAGFCVVQVQTEDHVGYVVTLDVAARYRRRGLARTLLSELEAKVRAAGRTTMALHVFPGNEGAVRFYQSIGYQPLGVAEEFYGPDRDALVYGKALS
jgi:[ribosomal protein S18]-alanine N-acetyltransferase